MDNPLATYRIYARLNIFKNKVQRATRIIDSALAQSGRPYVACSWGKDSICLLHLVVQQRPKVDAIWVRTDDYDEWPDTARVAQEFSRKWDVRVHTVFAMPVTECYRRAGGFYVFPETSEQKKADADYAKSFLKAIMSKADELECDLAFIGLRQEESQSRSIMLRKYGHTFFANSKGTMECFPLSNWTGQDVWSYITSRNLPYPELYDLATDRERARNGAMFAANESVYRHGQLTALKRIYPDLFNRFAAEFPEVRAYV